MNYCEMAIYDNACTTHLRSPERLQVPGPLDVQLLSVLQLL